MVLHRFEQGSTIIEKTSMKMRTSNVKSGIVYLDFWNFAN
jgi:hypothetical protein